MSNLNAIGVIMALLTAGLAVSAYMLALVEHANHTVVTGVRRGVSMSTQYRWDTLVYSTVPLLAFQVFYAFILALAFMGIARNVSDENVRMLAYLCAGWAGFGFFFIMVQGALGISNLVLILRKTGRA